MGLGKGRREHHQGARLRRWTRVCWGLWATILAGCSDGTPDIPDFSVGLVVEWNQSARTVDEVGFRYLLVVSQFNRGTACQTLSPTTKIWANDIQLSLVPNPNTPGCAWATAEWGPFLEGRDVLVQVREGAAVTAHATFTHLTPGSAATLSGTTGENLRAGEILVVRPVPEIASNGGIASFYPTSGSTWGLYGIGATTDRQLDGLHVTVPAFSGPAIFAVWNNAVTILPDTTCSGFAVCKGEGSDVLGPFLVSGAP